MAKKKEKAEPIGRVEITKSWTGLASMQVCAVDDATDEEILLECNTHNLSGTFGGWSVVIRNKKDCDENGGVMYTALPGVCADYEGHTHFIVLC